MKRFLVIVLVVVVLAAGGYFGISYFRTQRQVNTLSDLQTVVAGRGGLTATVGATGMVRANQTAILSWQTSGTIEQVVVEVGDIVESGQPLATLEQTSLSQNVILAQADLINAQNALDDLLDSRMAQAQALQAVYNAQKGVIQAERSLDVFDEKEYKDALDDARSAVVDREEELEEAQDDFEPYEDWDEDNDTRKSYKQDLDDAQIAYDEAVRSLDLLELEKSLAEANLEAAQALLADAQREYDRLRDGPDPDDIAVLEARIAAAQATLDLSTIVAPFAGALTEVHIKAGDRATPGSLAFRLDDLSRLLVDVQVSEVDVNRVQVGQQVFLTFDAILGKEYSGVVSEVSMVGNTIQGVVEFTVTVELIEVDEDVRPGMTAAVNIVIDQLDNVLLVPNRAVRIIDGQRVVYVSRDGSIESVKITLGVSSDTMSEVVDGGLRVGDVIILNPPQFFETDGPPHFMGR